VSRNRDFALRNISHFHRIVRHRDIPTPCRRDKMVTAINCFTRRTMGHGKADKEVTSLKLIYTGDYPNRIRFTWRCN